MSNLMPFAVSAAVLLAASLSCNAQEIDSPNQFIANWASSFNNDNPEVLLGFYEQSEDTELIMSAGIRKHGYSAIQDAYKNDFKAVRFYDSETSKVSVREFGESALVTFEHRFKTEFKKDGSRWQVHIRTTTVIHHKNGHWKILLEHSSPIKGIDRYIPIKEAAPPKSG